MYLLVFGFIKQSVLNVFLMVQSLGTGANRYGIL